MKEREAIERWLKDPRSPNHDVAVVQDLIKDILENKYQSTRLMPLRSLQEPQRTWAIRIIEHFVDHGLSEELQSLGQSLVRGGRRKKSPPPVAAAEEAPPPAASAGSTRETIDEALAADILQLAPEVGYDLQALARAVRKPHPGARTNHVSYTAGRLIEAGRLDARAWLAGAPDIRAFLDQHFDALKARAWPAGAKPRLTLLMDAIKEHPDCPEGVDWTHLHAIMKIRGA